MASSVFFGASSENIWGDRQRAEDNGQANGKVRLCSRPTCGHAAQATLSFDYATQRAVLTQLIADLSPELYDLCETHADRTSPPRGWELTDERFQPATQGRIFSDEADALTALIDDMKRAKRPRR